LSRIRRIPVGDWRIKEEVLEIQTSLKADNQRLAAKFPGVTSKFKLFIAQYAELFQEGHLRHRLFVACFLQFLAQFTGIIFYAPSIFSATGLSGNSINLLATGVVGIINFLATIPPLLYLDRWGRRPVLIAGAAGMSVSQLMVGTLYAVYQNRWAEHPAAGWAMAVFVWTYIISFAVSIGCVGWVLPSEIFPPAVRSKAVGLAIGTAWFSSVSPRRRSSHLNRVTDSLSSSSPWYVRSCCNRLSLARSTSFLVGPNSKLPLSGEEYGC
jgi:hypothetical protein